jgi:hypothetical protein
MRGAPSTFADFHAGGAIRTPGTILAHVGDLFDWALSIAKGEQAWRDSPPLPWAEEVVRFHDALQRFDGYLASDAPLACEPEQLFQGPIADALTHVGQITLLRRLSGAPIRSENYYKAEIAAGRVDAEQIPPRREFD